MELLTFLAGMSLAEREKLASQCDTSVGHLRNIAYGYRTCSVPLASAIKKARGGTVRCERLRADVAGAHLRGTKRRRVA